MYTPPVVLVVDDEPVNLRVTSTIVSGAGYVVTAVTTGAECLEVVERLRPDVVILDVLLPDIDGPVVSSRIKSIPHLEATYIILVSEKRITREDRVKGLTGGADSYLARPFTNEELLAYVETGLRVRGLVARLQEEIERRRLSEQEVRESHRVLSMAEAMASLGSWKWRPSTGDLLVSDTLREVLEIRPDAVAPSSRALRGVLFEHVHPEDRARVESVFDAGLAEQAPSSLECRLLTPEGETRWVRCEMHFERDPTGGVVEVCGCVQDVTDRFQREEERARLLRLEEEQRRVWQREQFLKNLHDGIGGITTNIALLAEIGLRTSDLDAAHETFRTIGGLAREGISEIRGVVNALERRWVTWGDLFVEMRRYANRMLEPHRVELRMATSGAAVDDELDLRLYTALLNILKEATANVVKHASAHVVEVEASVEPEAFHLSVHDDGVGRLPSSRKGRGLVHMVTRAEDLGGTLEFLPGTGTRLVLRIPLPPRYASLDAEADGP